MVQFSDRITIDETQALPEYDSAVAKAYVAQNKGEPLMALVVHGHLPTRIHLLSAFHGLSHPSLILVHETRVIDWPLTGHRHPAIIYSMPSGKRLAPPAPIGDVHGAFTPIKESRILETFIRPLGQALCQIHKSGLFHGSIRADNVFVTDGGARLGECLSAPCAYQQPTQYETIQRGLVPDVARGASIAEDDFYAFGVLVLTALMGDIPMRDLSSDAIVQMKIERGSYGALAGERRFTPAISELLHGLLTDDTQARWDCDDMEEWLSGRRLTPKPSSIAKKSSRPFRFGNQEYVQLRQLLNAMSSDTKLAAAIITNQELSKWIGHSFSDDRNAKNMDHALAITRTQKAGPEEARLVSNVQMALDPNAPIRYRGVSALPSGVPTLIAQMMLTDGPVTMLAEMLINTLPSSWLENQNNKHPDTLIAVQLCEKGVHIIQNKMLGFGVERFLYDSNPTLPCLNPQLRDRYVLTPKQLLEAMERRAPLGGLQLIDRHIAAFLMAKDKSVSTMLMTDIDQTRDITKRNIALLNIYARLQEKHGPDELKNLAALLLPLTEESVKRFHNRPRQERIRKDLKAAAATGKLVNLLALVDDPTVLEKDAQEFAAAQMLYKEMDKETARLAHYAKNKKLLADQAGQPLAAVIAMGFSFFILLIILLRLFQ